LGAVTLGGYPPIVANYRLLRTQKNDVLSALTQNDLDPSAFKWTEEQIDEAPYSGFRTVSQITHVPSSHFAQFDYLDIDGEHQPYFVFSPGSDTQTERYRSEWTKWEMHLPYVEAWAQRLKEQLDTPNLWAWASKPGLLSAPEASEDRFTPDEVEQLKAQIEEVRRELLGHASAPSEIEAVNDRLDYLVAATERQDRRAWFFLAVGVVVQLAMQIALPPDVATHVMQVLVSGLPPLIHG
jgi:hypothetical protein